MSDHNSFPHNNIRDGTNRSQLMLPAHQPDHVLVDERSTEDLLRFAQQYASMLRYFGGDNPNDTTLDWSGLFEDVDLEQAVNYLNGSVPMSEQQAAPYARPHFALLLVFLELLGYTRRQLNSLSHRHLEFFYRDVLRMVGKPLVPDQVHVLVKLEPNTPKLRLAAGTTFAAGEDSLGQPLSYVCKRELIASQVEIAQLRTLHIEREITGLEQARPADLSGSAVEQQLAFVRMLEIALGEPNPGDPLPSEPIYSGGPVAAPDNPDLTFVVVWDAYKLLQVIEDDLGFEWFSDFRRLMHLKRRREEHNADEWNAINRFLQAAGRAAREDQSFNFDPNADHHFDQRLRAALGLSYAEFTNLFDGVPDVRDIDELYAYRERQTVRDFFDEQSAPANTLHMNFADFSAMMQIKAQMDHEWESINHLIELARRRKQQRAGDAASPLRFSDAVRTGQDFQAKLNVLSTPPYFQTGHTVIDSIEDYYGAFQEVERYFHMSAEDYVYVVAIAAPEGNAEGNERSWSNIYAILSAAHRRMRYKQRRESLRNLVEADEQTNPLNALATLLGVVLDETIQSTHNLVLAAIQRLYAYGLNASQTGVLRAVVDASVTDPMESLSIDWDSIYTALEIAQRNRENYQVPAPETIEWCNLYPASDARAITVEPENTSAESGACAHWKTFGRVESIRTPAPAPSAVFGWALTSPLLQLAEGTRTITLTLGFSEQARHFDSDAIRELLAPWLLSVHQITDFTSLASELQSTTNSVSVYLRSGFDEATQELLAAYDGPEEAPAEDLQNAILAGLNAVIEGPSIHDPSRFDGIALSTETSELLAQEPHGQELKNLNRLLLMDVYSTQIVASQAHGLTTAGFNPFQVELSTVDGWLPLSTAAVVVRWHDADEMRYPHSAVDATGLKGLLFECTVAEGEPALSAPNLDSHAMCAEAPAIRLMLQPQLESDDNASPNRRYTTRSYDQLRRLVLMRAHLNVAVRGLKNLTTANDQSILDASKPFEPFGFEPVVGSRFYLGHPEIVGKQLNSLRFNIEWLGLPEDVSAHYHNYPEPLNADSFRAKVSLVTHTVSADFDHRLRLFASNEVFVPPSSAADNSDSQSRATTDSIEVTEWHRYLQWELESPDFQHSRYSNLVMQKSLELSSAMLRNQDNPDAVTVSDYQVNLPYTPTIKSLSLDYSAAEELFASTATSETAPAHSVIKVYHIEPFGYAEQTRAGTLPAHGMPLLSEYNFEGELYIGLRNVQAPQNVALLFQMAESSADPNLPRQALHWSYLSENRWLPLQSDEAAVVDHTGGLINSGIVELKLPSLQPSTVQPEASVQPNTRLPGAFYWIRVAIERSTQSVCDTIAIHPNALLLYFKDQQNVVDHLTTGLPPASITEPVPPIPELEQVQQPYSSFEGRTAEQEQEFYVRVSGRLRHKGRALTFRDYEQLALEAFPEMYKAKCLPADPNQPAKVRMVVIPEIKNRYPFRPFEPQASANQLLKIQRFLQDRTSPLVQLAVVNARYVAIQINCEIQFMADQDEAFCRLQLNEAIKKFLSPWAYAEGADLVIGDKIYANNIIDFIDGRPYVDYVNRFSFVNDNALLEFSETDDPDGYYVTTHAPDVVLRSAQQHVFEMVDAPDVVLRSAQQHVFEMVDEAAVVATNAQIEVEAFGIGHMIIENNFQVLGNYFGVGHMMIEDNFQVVGVTSGIGFLMIGDNLMIR